MHRTELIRKVNDMITFEDEFVERIAQMDLSTINYQKFRVTEFLRLKSGLSKLLDDSRRHREILTSLVNILSGDERDEY
ncbi:MAG: hypothetical protein JW716_05245 [Candidatus Aenigmarchaeota archaeon]|nr:hypothetical protein [Candidatus Aenigmarchaeota archaeon]